jgi:hypothetical protein
VAVGQAAKLADFDDIIIREAGASPVEQSSWSLIKALFR